MPNKNNKDKDKTYPSFTATDIYANTKCKKKESNVSIPTEDAVEDAKEWVDDENKM